jgi:uncharacterized membrane protein
MIRCFATLLRYDAMPRHISPAIFAAILFAAAAAVSARVYFHARLRRRHAAAFSPYAWLIRHAAITRWLPVAAADIDADTLFAYFFFFDFRLFFFLRAFCFYAAARRHDFADAATPPLSLSHAAAAPSGALRTAPCRDFRLRAVFVA